MAACHGFSWHCTYLSTSQCQCIIDLKTNKKAYVPEKYDVNTRSDASWEVVSIYLYLELFTFCLLKLHCLGIPVHDLP